MKIMIIGWYGTETIGDRAIMAGIISFLKKSFDKFDLTIGSIYPFYSQRMLNEDYEFWFNIVNFDIKINIFDSKNSKELDDEIKKSDLVLIGGGPLMHISPMYMLEYAFKKAKKLGKYTGIIGCGVGPIFKKNYKKTLLNITKNSDIIILRDKNSVSNLKEIAAEYKFELKDKKISYSFDPAVEAALCFKKMFKKEKKDYIALNLRSFPDEYSLSNKSKIINESLFQFVKKLNNENNTQINMIPMHYFHVGEDDREFLNKIKLSIPNNDLYVQNTPLSLIETMKVFQNAHLCIGMRFHSIVLQTILNGNNYILDYTEPQKGKIFGFINDIDKKNFYENRYLLLQNLSNSIDFSFSNDIFESDSKIYDLLNIYVEELNRIKEITNG